jgi:ribosome-associated protein
MDEFQLQDSEFVTLKDLLKLMGLCESGGSAMAAIAEGRVKVDGNVELRKRCKIRAGQVVSFEGHEVVVK